MILNSKFYEDITNQNAGKKIMMGLVLGYF
jgi:hypothetical protein